MRRMLHAPPWPSPALPGRPWALPAAPGSTAPVHKSDVVTITPIMIKATLPLTPKAHTNGAGAASPGAVDESGAPAAKRQRTEAGPGPAAAAAAGGDEDMEVGVGSGGSEEEEDDDVSCYWPAFRLSNGGGQTPCAPASTP